ncbi:TPA: tail fiber assembly protein [Serratia marcescens]
MSYGYSAKTNIFYVIEDKKGYEEFGNWPDDVQPISDEIWEKFSVQGPSGKMRGANKNGMPCWVDIPPPTREQQIDAAERKKALQLEKASKEIAPLQDAVDLNVATEQEQKKLIEWKHYRVALSRIDTSERADIVWPELPEQ